MFKCFPLRVCYSFHPLKGKKASAGSGWFPGGQSNQLPGNRHYHAGGTEALDVPQHPQRQATRERKPSSSADFQ